MIKLTVGLNYGSFVPKIEFCSVKQFFFYFAFAFNNLLSIFLKVFLSEIVDTFSQYVGKIRFIQNGGKFKVNFDQSSELHIYLE